jgi:hypothetical protein
MKPVRDTMTVTRNGETLQVPCTRVGDLAVHYCVMNGPPLTLCPPSFGFRSVSHFPTGMHIKGIIPRRLTQQRTAQRDLITWATALQRAVPGDYTDPAVQLQLLRVAPTL